MHLFFFFEFRPDWAVSADTGRYGRYGPSRPDFGRDGANFGRVGADFSRVGPIRESPRGTTRQGRAVCGVLPASPHPAATDASALAWEPCPCIPSSKRKHLDPTIYFPFSSPNQTHSKKFSFLFSFQSFSSTLFHLQTNTSKCIHHRSYFKVLFNI